MQHLGITRNTLREARKILRQRGAIDYHTNAGRGRAVQYMILKTDLAPELKGLKINPFVDNSVKGSVFERKGVNFDPFVEHEKGEKFTPKS